MRKKIAILTPLHPQKTGIADYIEELLPHLRDAFGEDWQIDLYTEGRRETGAIAHHRVFRMDAFEERRGEYDMAVYQIGNGPIHCTIYRLAMQYPGLVVLHDYAIHHMAAYFYLEQRKDAAAYCQAVQENHGRAASELAYQRIVKGEPGLWETDAVDYPMNRTLIRNAKGVIVFSEFARQKLEAYREHIPIHRVYLHCSGEAKKCSEEERDAARRKLKLNIGEELLIGVFGFIGPAKRPYSILEAAKRLLAKGYRFQIAFVGELSPPCGDLPKRIKQHGLQKRVRITGFISAEDFDAYVRASDICVSLRYPTMGENSGVLVRAMRYGKPSIVTDIGTFQEYPDDMVVKIGYGGSEVEELTQALERLIAQPEMRGQMSDRAVAYAAEYLEPRKTAASFCGFAKELIRFERIQENPMYRHTRDKLLDTYWKLGRCDGAILAHITQTLEGLFGQ